MGSKENIEAVERMQDYLEQNYRTADMDELSRLTGYSPRHCKRLFKQYTGRTIAETIRLLRLTAAARQVADSRETILDIALDSEYDSHEGFTKAFHTAFGIPPSIYRRGDRPIQYFIPFPIRPFKHKGDSHMKPNRVCTATFATRPARKLLFLPSRKAVDYFSFCEERGCDWQGLTDSIPGKLDSCAIMTLPPRLVPDGFGSCAGGVELPADYSGEIPDGYHLVDIGETETLFFTSMPYEDEAEFGVAIEECFQAHAAYDPARYGYAYALDEAPALNYGANAADGARLAFPVRRLG